jgi:integrase
MTDPKTIHTRFSEAEIKRLAELPHVRQLRDPRYPPLLLRFARNRSRASWHIVRHAGGKSLSTKLGNWPELTSRAAIELLPQKIAELTADPSAGVLVSGWSTVADLMRWYDERAARDRSLSDKRKATVRSLVARQLLPRVGSLRLLDVGRDVLDERLVWPMQETLSLAYTRQTFGLLKLAFRQAHRLKMLSSNPMADVVFGDFTQASIRPKPCALRASHIPDLVVRLSDSWGGQPAEAMLAMMMLCHGTRVGETRVAKWSNVDLAGGEWYLPAQETKTDSEHRLPLTRQAVALLKAYRARQAAAGYRGAYLFPRRDGKPLTDRQAAGVFERLGRGEWTSHDLRKLARSMWADLGVDYLIGELLLNHALDNLDATYIHTHATALKRDALERWHAYLAERGLFFATGTWPGCSSDAAPAQPSASAGWLSI